ncbi:MAG: replication-relaxation family protein, partial [Thermoanaerobaculia bacterium]
LLRLVFPGRARSVTDRRIRKLAKRGWVSIWEEPVVRGGHPHYALPTRAGLARGRAELVSSSNASPAARIVALMSRALQRKPLVLPPGLTPAFLAHQREVNHLLVSFERCPAFRVQWASSWDRPFPSADAGLRFPQPDYVAVFMTPIGPRLVFGEHDRGHESPAHFTAAKVDRYAALAVMPDVCERLFGFRTFEVWVTVIDARFRHPVRRLRELARVAAAGGAASVMRFALGGWVFDAPGEPVWFRDAAFSEGDSHRRLDHGDLECSAVVNATRNAASP